MPQIGSEQNPLRFNVDSKIKIRSKYYRNEDKKKADANYDKIFRNPNNPVNHREDK